MADGLLGQHGRTHARGLAPQRNAQIPLQAVRAERYRCVIGRSVAMQEIVRLAHTVAATNTTVLLLGESGTGKEVLARLLHQWSRRTAHLFLPVNCAALTPELLASELFGHEKGAFTGAIAQKKGTFELASSGTLFLDEIGELAPELQTKLLRVLEDKAFQRVGGMKEIHADVRILAATNRDLRQAMQRGAFRADLYYRLNVVTITLPPLRGRKEDIPGLVHHFITRYCREIKRVRLGIARGTIEVLQAYPWPGNVRELQNVIERAVVLSTGPEITEADFPPEIRQVVRKGAGPFGPLHTIDEALPLAEAVKAFKQVWIRQALERAGGNQSQAAKLLGLPQSNLSRLMRTLGLR